MGQVGDQKAKDRILQHLKWQGAQTAAELAHHLQLSPMAIRQHLQNLQAQQWIVAHQERRPQGRPVKRWQLTGQAMDLFPNGHGDLAVELLQDLQKLYGDGAIARLIGERCQRQLTLYRQALEGCHQWPERAEAIAQVRTQEGYMAEVIPLGEGQWLLVENHCPIYGAAGTCHQFCRAELELFRTLLGPQVQVERVEHLIEGDRRCVYRLSPLTTPQDS